MITKCPTIAFLINVILLWAELSSECLEVRDPDSGAELVIYSMMKQREVARCKTALRQGGFPSFRKKARTRDSS